jgi:hypothetical protein
MFFELSRRRSRRGGPPGYELAPRGVKQFCGFAELAGRTSIGLEWAGSDPRSCGKTSATHGSRQVQSEASLTQSRTLAALFDTLLPKLPSGECRVTDAGGLIQNAD